MGKKFLGILLGLMLTVTSAFASKLPTDVQSYLKKNISGVDIRFDGVIICPDGTLYLPLYPASFKKPETFGVDKTYPEGTALSHKPDVVIFNNDFVLLKIINLPDGKKTVKRFDKPPIQVKTGILPQDMLVPNGLIIPENIKGIIGNLDIKLSPETEIKVASDVTFSAKVYDESGKKVNKYDNKSTISQMKNKNLYMVTSYSKNIAVVNGESFKSDYSLSQIATPIDAQITKDNKFLIVTAYDSTIVNVISIADDRIIKQLDLTTQGGDIVMDYANNRAYISSPVASTIYVLDTTTMTLVQKIKVNGRCERLSLSGNYLLYVDKNSDTVWSIELANGYNLRNLGKFPNISKVILHDGIVYLASRTKSRVAVINYDTKQLITEFDTVEKPIDMMIYKDCLYVLGAQYNQIQALRLSDNESVAVINIKGDGFSTKFCPINDKGLVIVSDTKKGRYTIVDLNSNKVIKTNGTELPVANIIVGNKIKKINK